nr:hypothetical protein Iba_chr08fCG3380 [Ipomoea batatas]
MRGAPKYRDYRAVSVGRSDAIWLYKTGAAKEKKRPNADHPTDQADAAILRLLRLGRGRRATLYVRLSEPEELVTTFLLWEPPFFGLAPVRTSFCRYNRDPPVEQRRGTHRYIWPTAINQSAIGQAPVRLELGSDASYPTRNSPRAQSPDRDPQARVRISRNSKSDRCPLPVVGRSFTTRTVLTPRVRAVCEVMVSRTQLANPNASVTRSLVVPRGTLCVTPGGGLALCTSPLCMASCRGTTGYGEARSPTNREHMQFPILRATKRSIPKPRV